MFLHTSNVFATKLFHTWTQPIPNTPPQAFAWLSPPHPWSPRSGIIQQWAHKQINPSVPVASCTSLLLHSSTSHANYACLYVLLNCKLFSSVIFLFDSSAPCTWSRALGDNGTGIFTVYWGQTEKAGQPWQQITIKAMKFSNEIKQSYIIKNNHTKSLHDFGETRKKKKPPRWSCLTQKRALRHHAKQSTKTEYPPLPANMTTASSLPRT